MNILLLKIGAIGDVIMTTPFVRQLRKQYPHATIDYLVGKTASQVLENNTYIDRVIIFDEQIFLKKNPVALWKTAADIRKKNYDVIFVLDKHIAVNAFAYLTRIKKRIGFDRMGREGKGLTHKVYFDGARHEIYYYLDLLKKFSGKANYKENKPDIFLSQKDEAFAKKRVKSNMIVIAPGGANNPGQSAHHKLWPKENYTRLIKILLRKYRVIIVGDKNDTPIGKFIVHEIDAKSKPLLINMIGKTSIQQTAAIMKYAQCIICNDTGAMHIASAFNEKIISLFGPTDPKRFAPLHKKSIFLWKPNAYSPWNNVYGKFNVHGKNPILDITIDDVIRALRKEGVREEGIHV
jgi:lipopolysaccharide heptosyltransferase II